MKQLLALVLAVWSINTLCAQNAPTHILCGNEVLNKVVKERYPALKAAFDQTFETAKHQNLADQRSPLNIKVVVHIVWNDPAENLADSVIESQIQVLNEDFNRLNADSANLRPIFQPVAGNANIHFQLAETVRVQTDELFALDLFGGTILPELKNTSLGGSDAWDTEKYLNIWVCKIQPTTIFGIPIGQILGFAFPPNGLDNWPADSGAPNAGEDGVVIDYRAFGRNNPNPLENPSTGGLLEVKGRTPVHEVGHYLGLRHIWGDGGLLGPNNCDQSDGIDDTPYANAQSSFDCDLAKNTCEQVEAFYNDDVPDMVENYMDYSSETCLTMFSKGQVELMRNVLMGPRSGLLDNSAVPASPNALELTWALSPNPGQTSFQVSVFSTKSETITLQVSDINGKSVLGPTAMTLNPGTNQRAFDTSTWADGMYFVSLKTAGTTRVQKWLKQ